MPVKKVAAIFSIRSVLTRGSRPARRKTAGGLRRRKFLKRESARESVLIAVHRIDPFKWCRGGLLNRGCARSAGGAAMDALGDGGDSLDVGLGGLSSDEWPTASLDSLPPAGPEESYESALAIPVTESGQPAAADLPPTAAPTFHPAYSSDAKGLSDERIRGLLKVFTDEDYEAITPRDKQLYRCLHAHPLPQHSASS